MASNYKQLRKPADIDEDDLENHRETESLTKQSVLEYISEMEKSKLCLCNCIPKRYLTVVLMFVGLVSLHAMRVNVSVTVVTILGRNRSFDQVESTDELPRVKWNSQMVGFLHSIFYIGYLVTQIPGGLLITKAGFAGNKMLFCSVLLSSCLNMLLPLAIDDVGFAFTCFVRFLQGISEGVVFPSFYSILSHWTTPGEIGRLGGLAITGVYAGAVLGYPLDGVLTHYVSWRSVYFSHGAFGITWAVAWFFLSYEKPEVHPHISKEELEHFHQRSHRCNVKSVSHSAHVPWKRIFMSPPVWATTFSHFARNCVFYMLLTNQPTYFDVFGFNLAQNGALSSIPHLLLVAVAALSGPLADYLLHCHGLSVTAVRKIMNSTGFGVECVCMAALGFVKDGTSAVIFMSFGAGFGGLCVSGWQINHLDLAPRFSSILVGLTSTVGVTAGIASPLVIGAITTNQTIQEWNVVFLVVAGVLFMATVIFFIFGSGEIQEWNDPKDMHSEILSAVDPLEDKPYGIFKLQLHHGNVSREQVVTDEILGKDGVRDYQSVSKGDTTSPG